MMLGSQGDTLKETEGSQDMLYMQLLLQACRSSALSCTLSCLSKVSIAGTVGSNEIVTQIRLLIIGIGRLEKYRHL